MKRFFFPAIVAALCGIHCAIASPVARKAYVMPKLKMTELKKFKKITPKVEESYFESKGKEKPDEGKEWSYIMLPYELCGEGKNVKDGEKIDHPLYVDKLKVHVYVVLDMGMDKKKNAPKFVYLDKEIEYVDIPLPKQGTVRDESSRNSKGNLHVGRNEAVNAAVFFSPADMAKLSDELVAKKDKAEKISEVKMDENIAAVAVEFFHKDKEVTFLEQATAITNKTEYREKGIVVKKSIEKYLPKYWWRKERESMIQMRDISETPFAPFYSQAFPPTAKLYGGAAAGTAADDAPAETATDDGYVPPAATEPITEDEETTKSSKKKNKKNRNR